MSVIKENNRKSIRGNIYLRLSNQGRPLRKCQADLLDETGSCSGDMYVYREVWSKRGWKRKES